MLEIPVVEACERCSGLCDVRTRIVNGYGRSDARIAFVGQNPGISEDRENRPFVGQSGKLLALLCEAASIPRAWVYRTNAVRCLSPGNRKPSRKEIDNCRGYLLDELKALQPAVIVTLGEVPLQALYGNPDADAYEDALVRWEDECHELLTPYAEEASLWQRRTPSQRRLEGLNKPLKPKLPLKPRPPKAQHVAVRDVAGHTIYQHQTSIPIIPSYHPAFLMRGNWQMAILVIAHLEKARRLAEAAN